MIELYSDNKIAFTEYATTYDGSRAAVSFARVRCVAGGVRVFEGADVVPDFVQYCVNAGYTLVYVWDLSFFGAFLDTWAYSIGLPQYDKGTTERAKNGAISSPCWSALYTGTHGILSVKITLKRTAYTHANKHGRLGGLHAVEFRGFAPLFAENDMMRTAADLGATGEDAAAVGVDIIKKFSAAYEAATGEKYFSNDVARRVYTIGGAAQRYYLQFRYGKNKTVAVYQRTHQQDKDIDEYMCERALNLGGMVFFPPQLRKTYLKRKIYKYDVNGLYSATANAVGEISMPTLSSWEEYTADKTGENVYILVLKNVILSRKKHAPRCFAHPFTDEWGGDYIEIGQEYAIFAELWEALGEYYDADEYDVINVFKCEKKPDIFIQQYNAHFDAIKQRGKETGNNTLRLFGKLFLNSLIGKFIQATKFLKTIPYYDADENVVMFKYGDITDTWEKKHFDYIRGAYIYSMARVRVMKDLQSLLKDKHVKELHHFYTDTDSIFTDVQMPAEMVDDRKMGKYKHEATLQGLGVIAQKTYYTVDENGKAELTAAGLKRGKVLAEIYESYGDITPEEVFEALTCGAPVQVETTGRCAGGAFRTTRPFVIGESVDFKSM